METSSISDFVRKRKKIAVLPAVLLTLIFFTGCGFEPDPIESVVTTETKDANQKHDKDDKTDKTHDEDDKTDKTHDKTEVVEQVSPSVVTIKAGNKLGSGVIFREDGYIITNDHVVKGTGECVVRLADTRTIKAVKVGTDPTHDVAVIKIEEKNLQVATFADSDKVKVGVDVLAIGSPKGIENSTTDGMISNVNVDVDNGTNIIRCLQTSASINEGNSGGALVNMKGEVVGINSMGRSDAENMNYAIPSNDVVKIAKQLIGRGYVSRPYLGIEGANKMLQDEPIILITKIMDDSPAADGGLQVNDCIFEVNEVRVPTVSKLREQLNNSGTDSIVSLHIIRTTKKGLQEGTLQIKLKELPKGYYTTDWS